MVSDRMGIRTQLSSLALHLLDLAASHGSLLMHMQVGGSNLQWHKQANTELTKDLALLVLNQRCAHTSHLRTVLFFPHK